jgi:predicted amino acid dehydrogenase
MDKFGFIVHPIDIKQLKESWPALKFLPPVFIRLLLKYCPPFMASKIKGVRSPTGREIEGYFIACPLLPEQMVKLDENFVVKKIIQACRIAEKSGARIIGLGGYTSVVGDKGLTIAKNLSIPVTTGNSLTAWAVIEAILQTAKKQNKDLAKSTLAIIGASGSIGSLCARKLSRYFSHIVITARHRDKLEGLKQEISKDNPANITIEDNVHAAVKLADILVITTSSPQALLNTAELKSGAIVCDVSIPKNIYGKDNPRSDVTIIPGGLIKLPGNVGLGVNIFLPPNVVYGCVAETMLLTLEGLFESYSLGDKIPLQQLDRIHELAVKHGLTVWM